MINHSASKILAPLYLVVLYLVPCLLWTYLVDQFSISSDFLRAWQGGALVPYITVPLRSIPYTDGEWSIWGWQIWRIVTSVFLHKDLSHLMSNVMGALLAYIALHHSEVRGDTTAYSPSRVMRVSFTLATIIMFFRAYITEAWSMGISGGVFAIWGMYLARFAHDHGIRGFTFIFHTSILIIWASLGQNQQDSIAHLLGLVLGAITYFMMYPAHEKNIINPIRSFYHFMSNIYFVGICIMIVFGGWHSILKMKNIDAKLMTYQNKNVSQLYKDPKKIPLRTVRETSFYLHNDLRHDWFWIEHITDLPHGVWSNGINLMSVLSKEDQLKTPWSTWLTSQSSQTFHCTINSKKKVTFTLYTTPNFTFAYLNESRLFFNITLQHNPTYKPISHLTSIPYTLDKYDDSFDLVLVSLPPLSPYGFCAVFQALYLLI
jgi:membrane associated rhomboid family serine protease